jgi:hypothetical protein
VLGSVEERVVARFAPLPRAVEFRLLVMVWWLWAPQLDEGKWGSACELPSDSHHSNPRLLVFPSFVMLHARKLGWAEVF